MVAGIVKVDCGPVVIEQRSESEDACLGVPNGFLETVVTGVFMQTNIRLVT